MFKVNVGYDLFDNLNLSCGIVLYDSGETILYKNVGENDMFFWGLKYYF